MLWFSFVSRTESAELAGTGKIRTNTIRYAVKKSAGPVGGGWPH
jgi:hypothetical protein